MDSDGFGLRVRKAREAARWSQERLAVEAGLDRSVIARLELGGSPRWETAQALLGALSGGDPSPEWVAWFLAGHSGGATDTVGRVNRVNRRDVLKVVGHAVVPATLALRMIGVRSAPPSLAPELLDTWEDRLGNFSDARPLEPPRLLLPQIESHLMVLESLIALQAGTPAQRRRLMSLAAGTGAIAAWVSLMAGRRDDARDYIAQGERLAREVHDTDTLALLLMIRADIHSTLKRGGAGGAPERSLAALREALSLLSPSTPATVAAPLVMRAAEEEAFWQREDSALRLMDRGRSLISGAQIRSCALRRALPALLPDSFEGSILQLLGHPAEALRVLEPLTTDIPLHGPLLYADRAAAHAQRGELDAALGLLGEALQQSSAHGLGGHVQRIQGVRDTRLARWADEPGVRELDERLAAMM